MSTFTDIDRIPADRAVVIYGFGGRGKHLLNALRSGRPDIRILAFGDTYKSDPSHEPPVMDIDALEKNRHSPEFQGALILIASEACAAIKQDLIRRGFEDILIYQHEKTYAESTVPEALSDMCGTRHPLSCSSGVPPLRPDPSGATRLKCYGFEGIHFRPNGGSVCCWIPAVTNFEDAYASIDRLMEFRRELIRTVAEGKNLFCLTCPDLGVVPAEPADERFSTLEMDISFKCNLKCSYCITHSLYHALTYDPESVLRALFGKKLVRDSFQYTWGGFGEPTLCPLFAKLCRLMGEHGGTGLIYSNCLLHSDVVHQGIIDRTMSVQCSIDAGKKETYARIRGVDAFDIAWKNIAKYVAADNGRGIEVKYIVTNDNCGLDEIEGFMAEAVRNGVKYAAISQDFYEHERSPEVDDALIALVKGCRQNDIQPNFLPAAFDRETMERLQNL